MATVSQSSIPNRRDTNPQSQSLETNGNTQNNNSQRQQAQSSHATSDGTSIPRPQRLNNRRSRSERWRQKIKIVVLRSWNECRQFALSFCAATRAWRALFAALIVFTLVVSFALTDRFLGGPLARLGTTYGFLVLAILGKLTDYSLLAAADAAWEQEKWRQRLMPKRPEPLLTFLALSTGFFGWLRILFLDFRFSHVWWNLTNLRWRGTNTTLVAHPKALSFIRYFESLIIYV